MKLQIYLRLNFVCIVLFFNSFKTFEAINLAFLESIFKISSVMSSLDNFVRFSKQKHPKGVFKFFYCVRNLWPLFTINIYLFKCRIAIIVNGNHCCDFFIPKAKILTFALWNKILLNSIHNMKARSIKTLI